MYPGKLSLIHGKDVTPYFLNDLIFHPKYVFFEYFCLFDINKKIIPGLKHA